MTPANPLIVQAYINTHDSLNRIWPWIDTAQLGRELAEQRLDAEQKRFEVGMSTSFLVIQAQRDLAVARDNELRAYLDYQLATVAFERVQRARGSLAPAARAAIGVAAASDPSRR